MFVCCGFKNLDSFRIRLAHAADMMAEVAFGDELRQDGLIERRRMAVDEAAADANASTRRSGKTMNPRRSALKSILVKVPT